MRRSALTVLVIAISTLASASASWAQRGWMQQPEIIDELTNLRLTGLYPTNVPWSEQINADGTTDYVEGNERRPGTWYVQGELYCFAYALPHQGGCFRIVKHSPNCYELYTVSIGNVGASVAAASQRNGMERADVARVGAGNMRRQAGLLISDKSGRSLCAAYGPCGETAIPLAACGILC